MTDLVKSGEKKKPSYLKELLTHQYSLYGFLSAITAGAALSIVSGGLAAVPILGFAAAEGIASLFIPGTQWWRDKVDKKYRTEHREKVRSYLVSEISRRAHGEPAHWRTYERLQQRVRSLEKTAKDKLTQITEADVERIDDASVNYLSLWLAILVMAEREQAVREQELQDRKKRIQRDLKDDRLKDVDRRRLEKALSDLDRVIERRMSLKTKKAAAQSAMLSLADSIEEVYHSIMANPASSTVRQQLDEAITRMQIEEGVEMELDDELSTLFDDLEREQAAPTEA